MMAREEESGLAIQACGEVGSPDRSEYLLSPVVPTLGISC